MQKGLSQFSSMQGNLYGTASHPLQNTQKKWYNSQSANCGALLYSPISQHAHKGNQKKRSLGKEARHSRRVVFNLMDLFAYAARKTLSIKSNQTTPHTVPGKQINCVFEGEMLSIHDRDLFLYIFFDCSYFRHNSLIIEGFFLTPLIGRTVIDTQSSLGQCRNSKNMFKVIQNHH